MLVKITAKTITAAAGSVIQADCIRKRSIRVSLCEDGVLAADSFLPEADINCAATRRCHAGLALSRPSTGGSVAGWADSSWSDCISCMASCRASAQWLHVAAWERNVEA